MRSHHTPGQRGDGTSVFSSGRLKNGWADKYTFDPCFINHQDASKDQCMYERTTGKEVTKEESERFNFERNTCIS
jgi:hypothetical protein